MAQFVSYERVIEFIDSFVQKEFMEYRAKLEAYNNREMTDRESALLMQGFKMGFMRAGNLIMDSIPNVYRNILNDMLKEFEQTKVSEK